MKGIVYLIGAGPGDIGLMTVRGAELLKMRRSSSLTILLMSGSYNGLPKRQNAFMQVRQHRIIH